MIFGKQALSPAFFIEILKKSVASFLVLHQIHENLRLAFLFCTKFMKICRQLSCLAPNSSKSAASFLVLNQIHQNLRPAFLFST